LEGAAGGAGGAGRHPVTAWRTGTSGRKTIAGAARAEAGLPRATPCAQPRLRKKYRIQGGMISITNERGGSRSPVLPVVVGIAVVAAAAGWYLLSRPAPPAPEPVLSSEARAYVREGHLQLSDVSMGAKESFAEQMLVEITGKITNTGDRAVKLVEINCVFYDPSGLVVLRERLPIVGGRSSGGLKPGETRNFRLPFDSIPASWNQAMPQLVIARIVFD
jgi:hypothetical protein